MLLQVVMHCILLLLWNYLATELADEISICVFLIFNAHSMCFGAPPRAAHHFKFCAPQVGMAGNGEEDGSEYWKRVNERRRLHESFIPKNKYGNPLPRSQRWGDMAYEDEQREKEAAAAMKNAEFERLLSEGNFGAKSTSIKDQLQRLRDLNVKARKALFIKNIINPNVGDFKSSVDGKLYRFTNKYWKQVEEAAAPTGNLPERVTNPNPGDFKKVKGKFFQWVEEPVWRQVDRKTNYEIDLGETFDRINALGVPYLNARDRLWSIYYPTEPPIRRAKPKATRRNTRRKANRRKNNTRKY